MGVVIRELHTAAEMGEAGRVMAAVWRLGVEPLPAAPAEFSQHSLTLDAEHPPRP